MGKSSTARAQQAQQTRATLLETALNLFAEQGYTKTSIRAIARQAGLSDGLLYHHFPEGKQQILAVLLQQGVAEALSQLNQMNQDLEQAPLRQVLQTLCQLGEYLFSTHARLLKIILRESEHMQLAEIDVISQMFALRQQWLSHLLQRRHQAGEVREMNFDFAAQQFMATNLNAGLSQLLHLKVGVSLSDPQQRNAMIEHTLMLWCTQP